MVVISNGCCASREGIHSGMNGVERGVIRRLDHENFHKNPYDESRAALMLMVPNKRLLK